MLRSSQKRHLPVGEDPGSFPASHERSEQAEHQSGAVEQHVEAVRDQPETVGPNAVKQLHEGERLEQHTSHLLKIHKLYTLITRWKKLVSCIV